MKWRDLAHRQMAEFAVNTVANGERVFDDLVTRDEGLLVDAIFELNDDALRDVVLARVLAERAQLSRRAT